MVIVFNFHLWWDTLTRLCICLTTRYSWQSYYSLILSVATFKNVSFNSYRFCNTFCYRIYYFFEQLLFWKNKITLYFFLCFRHGKQERFVKFSPFHRFGYCNSVLFLFGCRSLWLKKNDIKKYLLLSAIKTPCAWSL